MEEHDDDDEQIFPLSYIIFFLSTGLKSEEKSYRICWRYDRKKEKGF